MTKVFNDEKVLVSFETKRKLSLEKQGTNMLASCLLGRSKISGISPCRLFLLYSAKKVLSVR